MQHSWRQPALFFFIVGPLKDDLVATQPRQAKRESESRMGMWNSAGQGSSGKQAVSVVSSAHSLADPNAVNSLQSAIGSLSCRFGRACECRVAI